MSSGYIRCDAVVFRFLRSGGTLGHSKVATLYTGNRALLRDIGRQSWCALRRFEAPTPHPQNVGNRQMPGLIIGKTFGGPGLTGLPARFQTATASFSEKRDQAPHLLIFLRSKTRLKPAQSPIDGLH